MADLVADGNQVGDQLAQAPALGDLGAGGLHGVGGNDAAASLALDTGGQDPLRAVASGSRLGALAVGVPAFLEALDERAGAQVAEIGDLVKQGLALGLEGGIDQSSGHGWSSFGQHITLTEGGNCTHCVSRPSQARHQDSTNLTYTRCSAVLPIGATPRTILSTFGISA